MKFHRLMFVFLALALAISACAPATTPEAAPQPTAPASVSEASSSSPAPSPAPVTGTLVLYSGRSEALIQPVIDAFKAEYPGVEVLLKAGSNSQMANALLEEKANPQADLFITTELFTIQSLTAQGIFDSYLPMDADKIPAEFIGPNNQWVGITRRARVIMYNTNLVAPEDAPTSLNDLTDPRWKGKIAAAGSTNGSMQAQIAAMRQLLGEEATEAWLKGLLDNDVTFFSGHTDVRKAVGAGEFAIGLVNHYYYHLQKAEGSPVAVVYPDQGEGQMGLITNATSAAIVKGGPNTAAARAFMDFLISEAGQKLFAEGNYEYPLRAGVPLHPDVAPLENFRLAGVNVAAAAQEFDATFDLMERLGLP